MKTKIWAALPLAGLLCMPDGAFGAQITGAPIVVSSSPRAAALAVWSKHTGQSIERGMREPYIYGRLRPPEGIVEVGFVVGANGRPDQVMLVTPSGDRRTDAAALKAIGRAGKLDPLPQDLNRSQPFRAQLLYLNGSANGRVAKRRIAALQDVARRNNAWYTREGQIASGTISVMVAAR